MIRRLLLPRNHEDHMPPKEKPQLSEQEVAVLHWWIASGAPFHKKVKEIQQTEKVKPMLLSFQTTGVEKKLLPTIPSDPVKKADEQAIKKLRDRGFVVLPVAQNSNYLMAGFVTTDSVLDSDIALLLPLRQQLVSLKLSKTLIGDSSVAIISTFKNISRLHLDHTNISDTGIAYLQSMNNLQYLNLVGTKITLQGLLSLKQLENLQSIYLYQTLIKFSDWKILANAFPNTHIDSGGYSVPLLESDTTIVKPKKNN